jgi:hypothetical protein
MSKETYLGIDYSCGLPMANGHVPNTDSETGIRYGVISVHMVTQAWCDTAEPEYPSCAELECEAWDSENEECSSDCCEVEAIAWNVDNGMYIATQSGDDSDIFVIKSPFYTYAQFCSPCAPGACHLEHPLDEPITIDHDKRQATENYPNNKCYCLGPDWFDDDYETCPYHVYRVATGELVYSPPNDK